MDLTTMHVAAAFTARSLYGVLVSLCVGCAPAPVNDSVSADHTKDPLRVKFVVNRGSLEPKGSRELDPQIPFRERMHLTLKRHAEKQLAARGWCPKGFSGPFDEYTNESNRDVYNFTVECLK